MCDFVFFKVEWFYHSNCRDYVEMPMMTQEKYEESLVKL